MVVFTYATAACRSFMNAAASPQEFYECGCIGRETCPGSVMLKEEEVPDNAVKTNIIGCYWRESVHL